MGGESAGELWGALQALADNTILPVWLDLADGTLSEGDLARWIRDNSAKSLS